MNDFVLSVVYVDHEGLIVSLITRFGS